MQVRIKMQDLLPGDTGPRGISASLSMEASAIHYDLVRIEEIEHTAARVGTMCDRIGGGFFQLAIKASKVLGDVIDFERYEDGVFSYEYLEWGNSLTLGRWLLDHIDDDAMYQIADNWSMVKVDAMRDVVTEWAAAVDLPLTREAQARLKQLRQSQPSHVANVAQLRAKLEYLQKRTSEVTEALLKATEPYAGE